MNKEVQEYFYKLSEVKHVKPFPSKIPDFRSKEEVDIWFNELDMTQGDIDYHFDEQ